MFTKKALVLLIIPLVIEQVLAATIGMADTLMVSSVGEAAVSGVSLVDSINLLLISIFAALATGGAIVVAQYLGRGDHQNANKAAKQLLLVTAGISLLITIACLACKGLIVNGLFGAAEPLVLQNAMDYFFLSVLSYPFIALFNAGAALFRSMGNSKVSMYAAVLMNAINIGGNAFFIYVCKMGVTGAALASLLSRFAGAAMMLILLRRSNAVLQVDSLIHLEYHPAMIKNILGIGIPTGLENGMFNIGKVLVQGLITSFGTVAITANAVANNITALALIPGSAIGLAIVTVVGQCVGAGDYKQAKRYTLKLLAVTYISMGVLSVLIMLCVPFLIQWYHLTAETAALTKQIIFYISVCIILLWPLSFAIPNTLRAAGDVKFTMTVSIVSMWVFRIGLSYVIGQWMNVGTLGVWIAMSIDWVFRSAMFVWRLFSDKWHNKALRDL